MAAQSGHVEVNTSACLVALSLQELQPQLREYPSGATTSASTPDMRSASTSTTPRVESIQKARLLIIG
jgi:hypothetical protein